MVREGRATSKFVLVLGARSRSRGDTGHFQRWIPRVYFILLWICRAEDTISAVYNVCLGFANVLDDYMRFCCGASSSSCRPDRVRGSMRLHGTLLSVDYTYICRLQYADVYNHTSRYTQIGPE